MFLFRFRFGLARGGLLETWGTLIVFVEKGVKDEDGLLFLHDAFVLVFT